MDRLDGGSDAAGTVRLDSARGRWILATAVLGSAIAFLDATVVNVALPSMGRDLGASTSSLQWVLSGYLLTLASLVLLGGSLGDRLGRRLVFEVGVAWFAVASLLCAVAPDVATLVVARGLQGVGAALLTPGSLAIVETALHPDDRPRAIGAWSGLTGVASATGPLLGGYLIDAVSWRAIFVLNLPIAALVIVTSRRHVPETRDAASTKRLDAPGAVLVAVGLAGATYALIAASDQSGVVVAIAATTGVAGLVGFFLVERRSDNAMVPLEMFTSSPQFSAANAVTFAVYAALGGVLFLFVTHLQVSLRYSPVEAGAATIPVTVLMLLLSSRTGALAQRIGARVPLTIGPLIIAASVVLMTTIEAGDGYWTGVLPPVLLFGAGLTLVVAPVTAAVLAAADERHSGVASGINNAVARVAGLLATAVLPLAAGLSGADLLDPDVLPHGFRIAMVVCAALAALGGALAWITIDARVLDASPTGTPTS